MIAAKFYKREQFTLVSGNDQKIQVLFFVGHGNSINDVKIKLHHGDKISAVC
jgi:hypothetical protein